MEATKVRVRVMSASKVRIDAAMPDAGHYLEACDRAMTIQIMIDQLLRDAPAILAHEDTRSAYERLEVAANDMYQTAGRRLK